MLVRQVGDAWEVDSPAKLNLYLEVLGRRTDGFHELETLMAPVRLADRLRWAPTPLDAARTLSFGLHPATPPAIAASTPADSRNLVWRAAELLAADAGVEPQGRFTLFKTIPPEAGLGGGSSNAAATLVLANAAWGLGYSQRRLTELAGRLGSDVPFFFAGGSAACRGRGELVEPIAGLPRLEVVIVKPPAGVSTPQAFAALQAGPATEADGAESTTRMARIAEELHRGRLADAGGLMFNRLEACAATLCPWIGRLRDAFARFGCAAHMMTGSGSAYFGLMHSARQARRVAGQLGAMNLGAVFATATHR